MRLIDADVLMPNAEYKGRYDIVTAYDIANAPTIELKPQKKGKWINNRDVSWMCSECGKWLDVLQGDVKMNYCPNCGADMRESFTIPTEIIESVIGYDD